MEGNEGGCVLSSKQYDALLEASDMVSFVSESLKKKCEEVDVDSSHFVDGLNVISQEIRKRLDVVLCEDEESDKKADAALREKVNIIFSGKEDLKTGDEIEPGIRVLRMEDLNLDMRQKLTEAIFHNKTA